MEIVTTLVSKVMWVENPEVLTLDVAAMLAAALVASMLILIVVMRPAEAAFPGVNSLIAFESDRITLANPTGDPEIYTIDPTNPNGSLTQLTDNTATDGSPAWSADGQKIAFASNSDGDYEVYTMKPNGTDLRRLTKNPTIDDAPDWSPSGKKIAYESYRGVTVGDEIFTMRADGSRKKNLTNNTAHDQFPAFSPDGTQIAFVSNRDSGDEIYVMNSDGTGTPTRLTNSARSDLVPDWQPL